MMHHYKPLQEMFRPKTDENKRKSHAKVDDVWAQCPIKRDIQNGCKYFQPNLCNMGS